MQKDKSIVFFGTSEFAVTSLEYLLNKGVSIKAVVTVPDKPSGRGKKILPSPIKIFALNKNIDLLQPVDLNELNFLKTLSNFNADLFVVVAFRKLPKEVWKMPPLKTINLHASLLPDYRGAAPINWALINGENFTGLTTFFINDNIDLGEILMSERVVIEENEVYGELYNRLKAIGAKLLLKTVKQIFEGNYTTTIQNILNSNKVLNKAPKIHKIDCRIDYNKTSESINNLIRGLSPTPTANTIIKNEATGEELYLKILKAKSEKNSEKLSIGEILTDNKTYLKVGSNDGCVYLIQIQPSGKNIMLIDEFLRGKRLEGKWKAL